MAAELVGGAFLSASLQVLFDRLASPKVVDFFKGRKLNSKLLEKLKITMRFVKVLLDDAEEKQVTDNDVRKWLDDLKDAFYEADDLLDEITYAALSSEMEAGPQTSIGRVWNFLSFQGPLVKIESKLVEIHEKLQHLVNQKNVLGLKEGTGEKLLSQKVPTTSLMDESVVYGRDEDKGVIIQLLLLDDANCSKLGLILIVGMGGVGKTTLAQFVYNDSRVKERFRSKAWIYVSEEFDVLKITRSILNGVSSTTHDFNTLNDLELCQVALKNELTDKKFLLVLDDVWNDRYDHWDLLLKPLKAGAKGSKIIVTTRLQSVASFMEVVHTHHLKEISEEECWALFSKHAFEGRNSSAYPKLEEIGREIVKKCNGLPLAAKSLGSLLRSKRKSEEWDRVLKNDIWNLPKDNILPALRLSYHFLPPHLKQCFAYCAIFPKGYKLKKEELVLLWMGEGFLGQAGFNKERDVTGEEYFDDLVSRSFFNPVWGSSFIMHDLINDLARSVAGEFCFRLDDDDDSCEVPPRTRHLCYVRRNNLSSNISEGIASAPLLRTFLLDKRRVEALPAFLLDQPHDEVIYDTHTLMKFERLRVLSLLIPQPLPQPLLFWSYTNALKLDDSIGNLKHLRHLNLSYTSIEILPESLCCLYNLEILLLVGCYKLVELPLKLGNLANLCVLDIERTNIEKMPPQMGKLKKLQKLSDFVIGEKIESSIQELGNLQQLRGHLVIRNLQNVMDVGEALRANIKGKIHLKELELVWKGDADDPQGDYDNPEHDKSLLEQLEPHENVETLTIRGYGGTRFPDWIDGGSPLLRVVTLTLDGCRHCCQLPLLGQLVYLKKLSIIDFPRIVTIGEECFPEESLLPPTLTSLEINRFSNLKSLEYKGIKHLTSLQHLTVNCCPELRLLPEEGLPSSLTSLSVWYLQNLESVVNSKIQQLVNLEKLQIYNCPKLKSVPEEGLPSTIIFLDIREFDDLESLNSKGLQNLTSLSCLYIHNCPKLQSFPKEGLPSSLFYLYIYNCPLLKKRCEREKGEDWSKISHIPYLDIR